MVMVCTFGELRRLMRASYSVCILERRLEMRGTSEDISTMAASGRYASSPSLATTWTERFASPKERSNHDCEHELEELR